MPENHDLATVNRQGLLRKLSNVATEVLLGTGVFGATPAFTDSNAVVVGSADSTKQARFEVDGFTTGTTRVFTLPNFDGTMATLAGTEELTNKTLNASVGKGTWTVSGTWTLPALTFGGTVSGGNNQLNNVRIGIVSPGSGAFTTISASGVITANGGILGTATNDNAAALNVGEYASATVASADAVSLTSDTAANVTSLSLTAGDWDVSGVVIYKQPGTTVINNMNATINTTSATLGGVGANAVTYNQGTTASDPAQVTPTVRISLAATTTTYLVARSNFATSTLSAYGFIRARRMR